MGAENKRQVDQNPPVHQTLSEALPPPIIDVVSATVTYIGDAPLGVGLNEPKWRIARVTTPGAATGITITEYPEADASFSFAWSERATLTYRR